VCLVVGLFSFSCSQRFFVVVVVVVEAELFYFPIETHTLEFNTPLIIIMYLFGTILLIQQLENGGDAREEEEQGAQCTNVIITTTLCRQQAPSLTKR
jgi:hypothetical protein